MSLGKDYVGEFVENLKQLDYHPTLGNVSELPVLSDLASRENGGSAFAGFGIVKAI